MAKYRIHVIKVPTGVKKDNETDEGDEFFPYSHYNDFNHDPNFIPIIYKNFFILKCEDNFKLKPNVQKKPRNRVDIYMPIISAIEISQFIISNFGHGNVAGSSLINPEDYRSGDQTLPIINGSKMLKNIMCKVNIGGYTMKNKNATMFIDDEEPNEGHIEMQGQELHLGILMPYPSGKLDNSKIFRENVPYSELRVHGENNPIKKSKGSVELIFTDKVSKNFASTLLEMFSE